MVGQQLKKTYNPSFIILQHLSLNEEAKNISQK